MPLIHGESERRARPSVKCRPRIEPLEGRVVMAITTPSLPLVIVPGQPGSFPIVPRRDPIAAAEVLTNFVFNEGTPPSQLTWNLSVHAKIGGGKIDFVSPYVPFIKYFQRHGYTEGQNLFVAVADWRLPVAPLATNGKGQLTGITTAQVSDGSFDFGVDYLAYAIQNASKTWAQNHGGVAPPAVNVISHSYGYFVTRAYLASPDYGTAALPPIHDFISMGGASDGVSIPYNWLNNSYVGSGSDLSEGGLYPLINAAYLAVVSGAEQVTRPGKPPITAASITDAHGEPDPKKFIHEYMPSFQDLMGTYDFLDGKNINNVPELRNDLLLEINKAPGRNHFAGQVGHVWNFYGVSIRTPTSVTTMQGPGGRVLPIGIPSFTPRPQRTQPGQVWYRDNNVRRNGDSLIPISSSVSTFAGDQRITPVPLRRTTHSSMLTRPRVQSMILGILNST